MGYFISPIASTLDSTAAKHIVRYEILLGKIDSSSIGADSVDRFLHLVDICTNLDVTGVGQFTVGRVRIQVIIRIAHGLFIVIVGCHIKYTITSTSNQSQFTVICPIQVVLANYISLTKKYDVGKLDKLIVFVTNITRHNQNTLSDVFDG